MINIESINPITQDNGPGIRVEVKLTNKGVELTPIELVNRIRKFRPYFEINNGGVTFIGIENCVNELVETCHICHKAGINTCIVLDEYNSIYDELLKYTDIIILKNKKDINIIKNKYSNITIY